MLAGEMLAEMASMSLDELVDVILLELVDERYVAARRAAARAKPGRPESLQRKTARVIPISQARHQRTASGLARDRGHTMMTAGMRPPRRRRAPSP
jgi:hypothetical protein